MNKLKVAIVSDELTSLSLASSSKLFNVTLSNMQWCFRFFKPDVLIVESCWRGYKDKWRYKIANYSEHPERNNNDLIKLLETAEKHKIPFVFWNKEDGVHFDRFIDSASLFKYILTVDENCLPKYKSILGEDVKVGTLPFAIQPKFHYPVSQLPKFNHSLFVGSYSHHIHAKRREWQDMIFNSASDYGLTIVDRNSDRKSNAYRYPQLPNMIVKPSIPYNNTGDLFRQYSHCLNVNTVTDSPSMFSRRLIEIMACGRLAVTNPSLAVESRFEGMCEVVTSKEQADELFAQLSKGYTQEQKEMMKYASAHVLETYNYEKWLEYILKFLY